MSGNSINQRGLNPLSDGEIGWLAGIFEGEGCCGLRGHTSFTVIITMTDHDVIERVHNVTGVGSVRGPFDRGFKPYKTWQVGSQDGIDFLEAILPWLGERRAKRAEEAISRWRSCKTRVRKDATHCVNGHEFTPNNTYITSSNRRGCVTCKKVSRKKINDRKRAERLPRVTKPLATHCKRGHEFTDENTYEPPNGRGRECKICRREYHRQRYLKRKASAQ